FFWAVREHRGFAHFIDLGAKFRRTRLALEKIDENRLPIGADQVEHERGAISVPGLSEAVEPIFRHEFSFVLKQCERLWPGERDGPAAGCLPLEAAGGE